MRFVILFISTLLMSGVCSAQLQDNNWCMGRGAGVSFNTTPPTGFSSKTNAIETAAAISDKRTGKLLFYTDGSRIWDATHNVMQNGREVGLDSTIQSTIQGAVIIPFINDSNKYYLFTIRAFGTQFGDLYYSVIDMRLNGGLGAVVPNEKKIKIGDKLTEAMVAVQGCGKVWLVTQKRRSPDFYVYGITASGVNTTPVISSVTYPENSSGMSMFRISPNNKMLASIGNIFTGRLGVRYIALHDFDNATGRISNGSVIGRNEKAAYYSCEFSANGNRLYASGSQGVYQYNVALPAASAIAASRQTVKTINGATGLQRRADGDIYVVKYESAHLDRISNSNALFPNCIYTEKAVAIQGRGTYNAPASIVYPIASTSGRLTSTDTTLCNSKPIVLKAGIFGQDNTWQDGSTSDSFLAVQTGIYWVSSIDKNCVVDVDTYNVGNAIVDIKINNDTTICKGDAITLASNNQPVGTSFFWINGSTSSSITVSESGVYTVIAKYKGCSDTDEVRVDEHPLISINLGADAELCRGDEMTLPQIATSEATDKYLWQDGSVGRTFNVTAAGTYYVTLSNQCQTISDSIIITDRNCHFFFPSAFTPNGDGRNDIAHLVGDVGAVSNYKLSVFNRWGERVFFTNNVTKGWDGNYKNRKAELGTYYYQIQYTYLGKKELLKGSLMLVR